MQSPLASFFAARALVKEARSQFYPDGRRWIPIITPSAQAARLRLAVTTPERLDLFDLPFDATLGARSLGPRPQHVRAKSLRRRPAPRIWKIRASRFKPKSPSIISICAAQDDLKQLLDSTVIAYQESLNLTKALYDTGIDSDEAVAQAETQLESTQAQDTNLGILRAQYEHAIALLVGAARFHIFDSG